MPVVRFGGKNVRRRIVRCTVADWKVHRVRWLQTVIRILRYTLRRTDYHGRMEDLTEEQSVELRSRLAVLRDELTALLETTMESTRPISLDEPIGRLTRMDAMQQQSMSTANRRQTELRLKQVEQALGLARKGDYGICRRCDDPIGYARLSARLESPYCLACQDEIDRKHS